MRSPAQTKLSPVGVIALAIACGFAAGYFDIAIIVLKKYSWDKLQHFEIAYDFPWTVPAGHLVLLALPGVLLALICAIRPKPMSLRAAAWLLATLAIWAALLRLPLYGVATLRAGHRGRMAGQRGCRGPVPESPAAAVGPGRPRGLLFLLAAWSSTSRADRDYRTRASSRHHSRTLETSSSSSGTPSAPTT